MSSTNVIAANEKPSPGGRWHATCIQSIQEDGSLKKMLLIGTSNV